jgi:diguanylate cyclase (GGDEF)-like protein
MKDKDRKSAESAQIYQKELQWLERAMSIQAKPDHPREVLVKEYIELGIEFEKLLKKTIKITRVGDSNQRKLLAANEQIESQKEELSLAYQKLDLISREDPLTQLSNRRDFKERFETEILRFERHHKPFSVLMGDIDDFKAVNDTYGHECGDFVLVRVAELIRSAVRKLDSVGRWGGEEFILLLPETPIDGAVKVAEEIRKRMEDASFSYQDSHLSITITIGVCQFGQGMEISACIAEADKALYQGKNQGKNRVVAAQG